MALIDVIIPVYNDRDYIKRTVDSIKNQTIIEPRTQREGAKSARACSGDITITLIDDCSTDGTSKLCDTLALLGGINVIHNETNLGVSASREVGVRATKSRWVFFIDHDDVIKEDCFEHLLAMAEGVTEPAVLCIRGEEREGKEVDFPTWKGQGDGSITVMTGHDANLRILTEEEDFGYIGSLWGKLIDRRIIDIILEETACYKDTIRSMYLEDALCMPILFHNAAVVKVDNYFCHIHRRLENSLSISLKPGYYMYDWVRATGVFVGYLREHGYEKLWKYSLLGMFQTACSVWYRSWNYETDDDKKTSYDAYVTELFNRYYESFLATVPKGVGEKVKYLSISRFAQDRLKWNRTIGKLWFETIYKFPLLAKKIR